MSPVPLDRRVKRDLVFAITATLGFFLLCFVSDANEAWVDWAEKYEDFELDELPLALGFAGLAFGWFAYRRWQDNLSLRMQADRLNEELGEEVARRTESEEALRISEQRSMDFASASADRFWETGPDFRYSWAHEAEPVDLRVPISSILGRTRWEVAGADPETDPKWQAHLEDHRAHRPIRDFEYFYQLPGQDRMWWRISAVPVFNADGTFIGHRGIAQDITEKKRIEEQLQAAQKLNAIGQLTGGVAHDFNNLLASVALSTELLRDRFTEGDKGSKKVLDQITRAVQRGRSLTDRLLTYARQQSLSAEALDIAQQIAGLGDLLRRTLGETIDLQIRHAVNLWPALVDPHQLDDALINLAINARDAMPGGGILEISSDNITLDEDFTKGSPELAVGDYVMISIRDRGVGMRPDVLEQAFEPFFTTKEFGEGSGLGLSMVYGFAKQSKGHVTIESQIGRGTVVKLYLPRAASAPLPKPGKPARANSSSGSEIILVVEDDPELREVFVSMLGEHGYQVVEARTGKEAIEHLRGATRLDLLLTDVVLPGAMNGAEIAEAARDLQPGIKALFITGYSDNVLGADGAREIATHLIRKPFQMGELMEKIRSLLGGMA